MIKAEFLRYGDSLIGFSVSGHAGGRYGQDIVCAAVSSAVILTANTITDYLFTKANVGVEENRVSLEILSPEAMESDAAKRVLASFKEHLEIIAADEKGKIQITVKEVSSRKGK